jgi:predicted ATPase/DNA-binding XRE family transcriptional regulator
MDRASNDAFREQLQRLRAAAGMTQEELAERAGLSRDAVSALERGRRRHPHPPTIAALAKALGLSESEARELRATAPKPPRESSPRPFDEPARPLPVPPTSLVGRAREVAELGRILTSGTARLVTLTGPGGVGKTRLALEVASCLRSRFPGGVAFVSLASVQDANVVLPAIAEALGVRDSGGSTLLDRVHHLLRKQPVLLLLDNFEHLTEAVSPVADLLAACPSLTVLATSRATLRLSGEHEYPVAPLLTPTRLAGLALDEFAANDAVALFVQRARAARPGFTLTAANADAVAEICTRLDGLPLAIELAAAWTRVLSPEALLARLGSRLDLLAGGPRDQAARLQSMRAAIGWSYDLLEPGDQELFRRLSVFAESFTLEAAEAVLAAIRRERREAPLPAHAVLEGIAAHVDRSLLRRLESSDGEPRFGMLSTIQEYGLEQLAAAVELELARQAHADWYRSLAGQAAETFCARTRQERFLDQVEADRGNIRLMLHWFEERCDAASLLELTGALAWFWYIRGPLGEGRAWLERSLAAPIEGANSAHRVRATVGAGLLAHFQGDDEHAKPWLEASVQLALESDFPWWRAFALLLLGLVAEDEGDYSLAELRFLDALVIFRERADHPKIGLALTHLGVAAWGRGDIARAAGN